MRRTRFIVIGIISVFFLCLSVTSNVLAKEKVVHIGVIGPLTGGAAFLGVDSLKGVSLAADEINASGGITVNGKKYKIKVVQYDDEATPAKGVAGLRKLKDRFDIPVVFCGVSGTTLAMTEINERLGILWCGFAKHPKITLRGKKLVLRTSSPIRYDNEIMAKGAVEYLNAKNFATLCDLGDYGRGCAEEFAKAMVKFGAKLVGQEWYDMRTDSDFRVQITKIKALKPDTIYIAAYDEATGMVVKQLRELGIDKPLILSPGFQEKGREITGPERIEGCLNLAGPTSFGKLPQANVNYRANFQKKYGKTAAPYGENYYEVVYIIARGMEKAGTVSDPYKIKEGMKAVVPIEREHRTAYIKGWKENGDPEIWETLGVYRKGELVPADPSVKPPK